MLHCWIISKILKLIRGVDKGSMYIWYCLVNHANICAGTTFMHCFYNFIVCAHNLLCSGPILVDMGGVA